MAESRSRSVQLIAKSAHTLYKLRSDTVWTFPEGWEQPRCSENQGSNIRLKMLICLKKFLLSSIFQQGVLERWRSDQQDQHLPLHDLPVRPLDQARLCWAWLSIPCHEQEWTLVQLIQHCSLQGLVRALWMSCLLLPPVLLLQITVTWVNLHCDWCSCEINANKSLLLSDATTNLCLVQVPLAEIFVCISCKYQAPPVEYTMMYQITHETQSFHIHHLRLTGQNFAVCSARNNALLLPAMGKLSQNPSAIDFHQGQESGPKELTIPYKTSLKYKLCWDFNLKITQRVSHTTPAHRYIHIYISPVHFSPHLLKPKHNDQSLSLSVLQPQGLFFPSEESITHGRMLGKTLSGRPWEQES